jgi:flagellum-specific ATP synthase
MTNAFGEKIDGMKRRIREIDTVELSGTITKVIGMTVESKGPLVRMGDICKIYPNRGTGFVYAEVVGFNDQHVLLMPFGDVAGIGAGNKVTATGTEYRVGVGQGLKGRILDALGHPIDGLGAFIPESSYPVDNRPPNPLRRSRISEVLPTGVRAIDSLLTLGKGQRVGIFAGSGVGKSTLLGMIARRASADINVITLVGERGREVKDFIEKDLKEEGLKKSVLVVATSDQPALLRLKSAMVGTAIAEYFRDLGCSVMLMMDSLTRFAMAQREIGMTVGEPPVSRGFTPSVYAMLPRLLERSGTSDKGSITGIYTVLVEGDDLNEPISDTVRGILDGHIVLSRKLANSNQYPAIDILASVSRLMADIAAPGHKQAAGRIKDMMMTYEEVKDLVSIGAYKEGSDARIDQALALHGPILELIKQDVEEESGFDASIRKMQQALGAQGE